MQKKAKTVKRNVPGRTKPVIGLKKEDVGEITDLRGKPADVTFNDVDFGTVAVEGHGVIAVNQVMESPTPQKVTIEPLAPGQCYFESPEGHITIGDNTKNEIWDRTMNNGKGGWANKKR